MGAAVRGMAAGNSEVPVTDDDRCERLGKECVSSVSVRKLTGKRAPNSRSTQIEHLKNKIENLVTLLRNQAPEKSSTHAALDAIGVRAPASSIHSSYCETNAGDSSAGVNGDNAALHASGTTTVSSTKLIDPVLSVSNVSPASKLDIPSSLWPHVEPSSLQAEVGLTKSLIYCRVLVVRLVTPGY